MSEFVNYNKREVTLPLGCKNLSDVLSNPALVSPAVPIALGKKPVTRDKSFTAPLSEVGKYVAMVFQSHSLQSCMYISLPDERLAVHLTEGQGIVRASVVVQKGSQEENFVWEFFLYHGLVLPSDFKAPFGFHQDLPWKFNCEISPLPSEPFLVSQLIKDLFRYVCDLSGKTMLQIRYSEIIDAA